MNKKTLIPISGRLVPDPEQGGFLQEAGREVVMTPYWQRRLACGDVQLKNASPVKSDDKQKGSKA